MGSQVSSSVLLLGTMWVGTVAQPLLHLTTAVRYTIGMAKQMSLMINGIILSLCLMVSRNGSMLMASWIASVDSHNRSHRSRCGSIWVYWDRFRSPLNLTQTWDLRGRSNGLIDEYLMFHRALSEEEIAHLASGPSDPFADLTAVDPNGKLSTTWADIKASK